MFPANVPPFSELTVSAIDEMSYAKISTTSEAVAPEVSAIDVFVVAVKSVVGTNITPFKYTST
jgi:hypothetical protein